MRGSGERSVISSCSLRKGATKPTVVPPACPLSSRVIAFFSLLRALAGIAVGTGGAILLGVAWLAEVALVLNDRYELRPALS
jgi:hypothetical protein